MPSISINHQLQRLEVSSFEVENKIIFNYFNNLSASEREDKLMRAIYIGVLALMEDRISSFLSKTSNELGTELESLKMIFDMKMELFYKTSIKGNLAEEEIASFLNEFFDRRKINDKAFLTGNTAGLLDKNKTGDIICELNNDSNSKIVIECKFDKSIRLGDVHSKDVFSKKHDTAWSQLIEAQVNRDARASIIVFDLSLTDGTILREYENVGYIPNVGFIAIVDSQKGDYSNLAIAYTLARDIAINSKQIDFDKDMLRVIVTRIVKDINEILAVRSLVELNISNNKAILKQLEKSMLIMDFNREYLLKFLTEGSLTKKSLLEFYSADTVKEKYKLLEREIENL